MARLGTIFLKSFNFITNGNLYMNRIKCEFSPLVSTIKSEIVQKFKDLQIPEKPKKPINPYLLFSKDQMEKLKRTAPLMTHSQMFQKCGQLWKDLDSDQKAKYHQVYKDLQLKFEQEMLQYTANLTKEQKLALNSFREAKKKAKQGRRKRKELIELGKPKRPQNAYALFVAEMSKMRNVAIVHLLKDAAQEWKNLTDTEKKVYSDKAKKLYEDYEKKLTLWEDKMKLVGRDDLVRKKPLETKTKRQSRILKYGQPEHQNS